jgi:DnaK suppressor protein
MIQAHPDAELSHAQLAKLAEQLAAKRNELVEAQTALKQEIATKDDCGISDAAEAASLQQDRLRANGLADQNRRIIAEIDGALSRLQNGQYGVSKISGEPISYKRLRLVPWARTGPDDWSG